jgi:hypothetical protein
MTMTTGQILAVLQTSARRSSPIELPVSPAFYSRAAIDEARAACKSIVRVDLVPGTEFVLCIEPGDRLEDFLLALLNATVRGIQ